jgi:transglutaminase-like putative cysteine protease
MSRLRITHTTSFSYDGDVDASYNELRMRAMMSDRQFVLTEHVHVTPVTSQHPFIDYWGTRVSSIEILAPHSRLDVVAECLVEVSPPAPPTPSLDWDGIRRAAATSLPLTELLETTALTAPTPDMVDTITTIKATAKTPDHCAREIAAWIYDAMTYQFGITQVHSTAADAWAEKKGVCQDISHLVLGALRFAGIPARYVSGYYHPQPDADLGVTVTGESHAWVEWFTGGFTGHDPTNDQDIGERHVIIGRGRDYGDVPPIRGIYDGPPASQHSVEVELTRER